MRWIDEFVLIIDHLTFNSCWESSRLMKFNVIIIIIIIIIIKLTFTLL